jgi:hypothetical protein
LYSIFRGNSKGDLWNDALQVHPRALLHFFVFVFDTHSNYLVHYILTNSEENILSDHSDSLGLAALNAAVVLVPKNGGRRIEKCVIYLTISSAN